MGWALYVAAQVLSQVASSLHRQAYIRWCWFEECFTLVDWDRLSTASVLAGVAGAVGCASAAFATYFLARSRRLLRERHGIAATACDDCCVSFLCGCCATVQMFRQEGVAGRSYRPCSEAGTEDAPVV